MYTTIIHPLRKAYNLSLNEYCVLDTIYHLSNNEQFWWWCIKSKANIADDLDLWEATIYRIIDNLIDRWLIKRDENTKYLRITDEWSENIANKDKWSVSWKNIAIIWKHDSTTIKMIDTLSKWELRHYQNDSSDTIKMIDNNNIDNNIDNNINNIPATRADIYHKDLEKLLLYWNNTFKLKNRMTDNLLEQFKKTSKKFSKEEIELAVINYREQMKVDTYNKHRFSLFEFLKQGNWLVKFLNK